MNKLKAAKPTVFFVYMFCSNKCKTHTHTHRDRERERDAHTDTGTDIDIDADTRVEQKSNFKIDSLSNYLPALVALRPLPDVAACHFELQAINCQNQFSEKGSNLARQLF